MSHNTVNPIELDNSDNSDNGKAQSATARKRLKPHQPTLNQTQKPTKIGSDSHR